jgi:hypothetical protein
MNESDSDLIRRAVDELLGGQERASVSRRELLEAFTEVVLSRPWTTHGEALTTEDIARHYRVSTRRVRAKAQTLRRQGLEVGTRLPGKRIWIFSPADLKALEPQGRGRPSKRGASERDRPQE